ncbi:uncharacterized protein LOC117781295 [Drosophila innubila]|uniref:uncharacterized protein LOC117781295 n=1 Tax=Drosophila innubila TaxID=198719 RepID=UPI00148C6FD5|nr:uncharacterized protein LOC117781295 [Drosophila innubila]
MANIENNPKIVADFIKIKCVNQWPELVQLNCHINRTDKNISALYADIIFSEDIQNLNGIYNVAVERDQKFVDYTTLELDYCTALHLVHSQSLIQIISSGLRRVSNFPLSCPLKKNKTYFVNGFTLDPKIIPIYMPKISFRTNATCLSNKREIFYITCFGRVMRK